MAKKVHQEEHENHERWLVSYADFVTLLFATFTALYAMSQVDSAKADEFQKSVQKAFRSFIDFGGVMGKFVDTKDNSQLIQPPIDVVPREGAGPQEVEDFLKRQLEQEMTDQEMQEMLELRTESAGVVVSLSASSFFDPGEALVKEQALPELHKVAKALIKTKRNLIVEGHTDNDPIHNKMFRNNWDLSAARAATIAGYFQSIHRYPARKLIVVGYADQRPLFPNDTPVHKAKNRRIDILIVTDDKAVLK